MELAYKSDFDRVRNVWIAFWEGEIIKRPPVLARVPRPGSNPVNATNQRYLNAVNGSYQAQLDLVDRWLESTDFLAELIPTFAPDHGPDQIAACLGSRLVFNPDSEDHTNWAKPVIDDWNEFLPIKLSETNETWRSILRYNQLIAQHSQGRYLVSGIDFHTHYDALAALRHNDRLCMDFYDHPDLVMTAGRQAAALFPRMYTELYKSGAMGGERGCIGSHPFWSPGTFATIQCDFIALVGPKIFRRFIMPAIEAEAAYLNHCSFHLDGPGALTHLEDILSIRDIDVIQWVPGAGQEPDHEWLDLHKRIQAAGKATWIRGVDLQRLKAIHHEIDPTRVIYSVHAETREEVDAITAWLEANT